MILIDTNLLLYAANQAAPEHARPQPGGGHRDLLAGFLTAAWMTSRLVPDAHLAALAIEHGLTLSSTDGDFAKFPGLRWENPLSA